MLKSLIFPTGDARQSHRIKRWMMASGTSMMVVALFFAAYLLHFLDFGAFATAALLTVGFIVLFYAIFRSGLNQRFHDPSLTLPQIMASFLVILYVLSQSKEAPGILALLFMVSFLFGVFRLRTRQLLTLTAFSVLIVDIDHFKRINDALGHHAGDVVLSTFARAAAVNLRQTDVFGRYGSEEFLAILEQTPVQNVTVVAERLCALARGLNFDELASGLGMTVSIGGADYRKPEVWQTTLERADQALYRAKKGGCDRFVQAPIPA
jgi:diguanylate cyclase (GGDEF)-like protein